MPSLASLDKSSASAADAACKYDAVKAPSPAMAPVATNGIFDFCLRQLESEYGRVAAEHTYLQQELRTLRRRLELALSEAEKANDVEGEELVPSCGAFFLSSTAVGATMPNEARADEEPVSPVRRPRTPVPALLASELILGGDCQTASEVTPPSPPPGARRTSVPLDGVSSSAPPPTVLACRDRSSSSVMAELKRYRSSSGEVSDGREGKVPQLWPIWQDEAGTMLSAPSAIQRGVSRENTSMSFKIDITGVRGGDTMTEKNCFQFFVFGPNSKFRFFWDIVSVMVVGYDVLAVPLLAFESVRGEALTRGMTMCNFATTIFWSLDMIVNFFSGFHVGGVVEMRPSAIAKSYCRGWFFLDLTILLTDWILFAVLSGATSAVGALRITKTLRLSRILRLCRLLRAIKLPAMTDDLSGKLQSETLVTAFGVVRSVAVIAVVNHFIACTWYFIGDTTERPSWVHPLMEVEKRDMWYRYGTALHWSLTQFTPASMEVVPRNAPERFFAIMVLFSALITFSTFVSSITNAMTNLRRINVERSRQRESIRRYIADNRVSLDLGNRITAFLRRHSMVKRRVHEADISLFKVLPESLRLQLHWEVYSPHLLPHPFFHELVSCAEESVIELCHFAMNEQHLDTGFELFAPGQAVKKMSIVVGGLLEYSANRFQHGEPMQVEDGAWICEVVLWLRWDCKGKMVALAPAELIEFQGSRFRGIVLKFPEVLVACRSYSQMYLDKVANADDVDEWPLELWWDHSTFLEFAQKSFEISEVLRTSLCSGDKPQSAKSLRKLWRSWSPVDFVRSARAILHRRGNTL